MQRLSVSSQERYFISDGSGGMVFASSVFASPEDALASASTLLGELGWTLNKTPYVPDPSGAFSDGDEYAKRRNEAISPYRAEKFVSGFKATQEGETLDELVARVRSWETERARWNQ